MDADETLNELDAFLKGEQVSAFVRTALRSLVTRQAAEISDWRSKYEDLNSKYGKMETVCSWTKARSAPPDMTPVTPPLDSPEALKYDDNKLPLDLLPPEALEEIARVLQHGAKKYDAHNWRKGMKWSRLYAAHLRHLFAWAVGENIDPESGLRHLAHAGCCLLFLLTYQATETGEDDRF